MPSSVNKVKNNIGAGDCCHYPSIFSEWSFQSCCRRLMNPLILKCANCLCILPEDSDYEWNFFMWLSHNRSSLYTVSHLVHLCKSSSS
uniref:Uncharacterized protein n=1 Tax=Strigamia maritima TaxID=126957 RepID=T1IVW3_STRMM